MLKKICLLTFCFFLVGNLHGEIIYKDFNKPSFDLSDIPISVLQDKLKAGDIKAAYLLALHKVRGGQKEKNEGVAILEKLAQSGVLDASEALYEISSWVKVERLTREKAFDYLRQGAEGGYAVSQFELAKAYHRGILVNKNLEKYHFWAEKAAEQGHAYALIYTANDYYAGRGVPKSDKKGFEWLMRAYEVLGRDFDKWSLLAEAYETGRGTPVDLVRAYMCYDLDGTAGIEEKARIAPRMTAVQRAEGLRLSQEWQQKNHVYTMQSLGLKRQKDGSYQ